MRRFVTTTFLNQLWRRTIPMASTSAKRQLTLLPFNHAYTPLSHHRGTIIVRPITSESSVSKDVPQAKTGKAEEKEKIDLDIWKSVMRSQVTADEKHGDGEEGAEGGDMGTGAQEGTSKEASTPEATRELIVMWRLAGRSVPEHITDEDVQKVSELTTKTAKKKYLRFLASKEIAKKNSKRKKLEKAVERASRDKEEEREMKNTFFLLFRNRSLDRLLAWRSAHSMIFGQPLVFDMSYEANMSEKEMKYAVSQLMDVEAWNRRAVEPFHLHFCNLQPNGAYKRELLHRYAEEAWDQLNITSTHRSYIDVLPREHLVYLTADSPNILHTFDHSKIYIVGAFVDHSIQSNVSLANAKRLNLPTARLPLEKFLHWQFGGKNLTLDQMIRILLTVKETGKWEKALEFVPTRKHGGLQPQPKRMPSSQERRDWGSPVSRTTSVFNSKGPGVDERPTCKQGDDSERPSRVGDGYGDETFRGGNRRFLHPDPPIRERSWDGKAASKMKPAGVRIRTSLQSKINNAIGKNKKPWCEGD